MATLLLDRADLEIRMTDGALALFENGCRSQTIPLRLIDRVIVQGARTRIDTAVLIKLAEAGATTLLLSPRAGRQVAIVLGPAHNEAAIRLAQARRTLDLNFCNRWAQQLVIAKLRRQHRLLHKAQAHRPDLRKALFDACGQLADALTQATETGISSARLRGLEGSAARAYFRAYTALFAAALNFTGRNRRPPRDPVNACLSLAYTLLHFEAVRAAHAAGLDPLLGYYHRPAFGRESLACDLIEPLRPHVDAWIWQQFTVGTLRAEHFFADKGACLLGKAGRGHFYANWERFAPAPRRWLRQACTRLARQLRAEGEPWLAPGDGEDDDEDF
ncbi:MAG TPA: CRISPR-associated endonuclease Cas1 [Pseudothauera hydrothermalis]|nr:CRISPR-associated endonuclease Cas1 [Rhodocyclaceae bacterium]AVZ79429.1 CRISPR-associated endonuclease Cas1 [Zoogloeaceae bacteirum Par-f-2]HNQ75727.1 CRISPR-associated endonuclease Cas1 [Pseudothauera hydrothermalis]